MNLMKWIKQSERLQPLMQHLERRQRLAASENVKIEVTLLLQIYSLV